MPISEKRLAANRANAKKSTGPRTPEGKHISSQNALQHGVLAKAILIEGECPEGFLNLRKAYDSEYNPQTPTEQALVNKAVTAQWRALRAASMESTAITHEIQRQSESTAYEYDATRAMLALRTLNETSAHMERLSRYEHRFDVQHRHAIRDLLRLREAKVNLNKRTHLNEATKGLIAPRPAAKAIDNPSKAAWKPTESHQNP